MITLLFPTFTIAVRGVARRWLANAASIVPCCCLASIACAQTPIYTQVSAGDSHSCAVTVSGAVHCWGANTVFGVLGNGSSSASPVPVPVAGISGAVEVRAGAFHTCARLTDGSARCWGKGSGGALVQGSFDNSMLPVTVWGFGPAGPARQIGVGAEHTCILQQSGQPFCAGRNDWGQAALAPNPASQPWSVPLLNVNEIAVGAYHSCARVGGTVSCWGQNTSGQLGNGSAVTSSNTPVTVTGISTAIALSAGRSHTCALLAPGGVLSMSSVVCWGDNAAGQLGTGSNGGFSNTPVTVANLGSSGNTPDVVAAGAQHTCARLLDATVQCWGLASYGAVGDGSDGTVAYRLSPTTVGGLRPAGAAANAATTSLTAGNNTSCVIMSDGGIRCWGANDYGQGGHGHNSNYQTTPQYIAAPGCALDLDGDGVAQFTTDGLLLLRALTSRTGTAVTQSAIGARATRTTWTAVLGQLYNPCGVTTLVP